MAMFAVLCALDACGIFIDMHVFLIQKYSEDSSSQQAQPVSSLAATCSQSTASVVQQWPSNQRAQMRHCLTMWEAVVMMLQMKA